MKTKLSKQKTLAVKIMTFMLLLSVGKVLNAQAPAKWAVNGNISAAGDFLGTVNNEDLIFKTNNNTALKIKANGNIILKSLEGAGDGLISIDNNGKAIHVPFTGDANQVFLGNGTFGTLPGVAWSTGTGGKIYYNGGKVGIGTATPNFKLDVDGDMRITQNLYLQGELIISDKIQTPRQMKAGSIVVDSLLMDSTKAVYGITTFKDEVKLSTKLSVDGAATIGGSLKVSGGLTLPPGGPISEDPCIHLMSINPISGLVTPISATAIEAAFDPTIGIDPCPSVAIPFTWGTYGNHVNNDLRWIGTIENFDFRVKTFNRIRMIVKKDGDVGIGTALPSAKLNVEVDDANKKVFVASVKTGTTVAENFVVYGDGHVFARDIKVNLDNPFAHPDYVFENNYKLMSLSDLELYLSANKHLPNIPSTKEVKENNGISLGEMSELQLQKIEELTLYVIELNKKLQAQELKIKELRNK